MSTATRILTPSTRNEAEKAVADGTFDGATWAFRFLIAYDEVVFLREELARISGLAEQLIVPSQHGNDEATDTEEDEAPANG